MPSFRVGVRHAATPNIPSPPLFIDLDEAICRAIVRLARMSEGDARAEADAWRKAAEANAETCVAVSRDKAAEVERLAKELAECMKQHDIVFEERDAARAELEKMRASLTKAGWVAGSLADFLGYHKAQADAARAEADKLAAMLRGIANAEWRLTEDGWRVEGGGRLTKERVLAVLREYDAGKGVQS